MNKKNITQEAHRLMNKLIEEQGAMHANWMVTELMAALGEIEGENAVFFRECAWHECYLIAKRVAGTYLAKDHCEDTDQMKLLGMDEIRSVYTVEREGVTEFVHVKNMTPQEKIGRGQEMRIKTEKERKHADQLIQIGELELEEMEALAA